jgi:hypothetical protein
VIRERYEITPEIHTGVRKLEASRLAEQFILSILPWTVLRESSAKKAKKDMKPEAAKRLRIGIGSPMINNICKFTVIKPDRLTRGAAINNLPVMIRNSHERAVIRARQRPSYSI